MISRITSGRKNLASAAIVAFILSVITTLYGLALNIVGEAILGIARLALPAFFAPTIPVQIAVSLTANFIVFKILNWGIGIRRSQAEARSTHAANAQNAIRADFINLKRIQNIPSSERSDADRAFLEDNSQLEARWVDLERQKAELNLFDERENVGALKSLRFNLGMATAVGVAAILKPDLMMQPMGIILPGPRYLVASAGGLAGNILSWAFARYSKTHRADPQNNIASGGPIMQNSASRPTA